METAPASRLEAVPARPILWVWGVLTVGIILLAYVFALGLAAGCGWLALTIISWGSLPAFLAGVGAATCAVAILWSLVPRRDRFQPPGPELTAAAQPRLFDEIARIAAEFREPMPAAVYLMFDPNAWVAQRGGRRVMALGLPLLPVLTISEFRAVLAHEFAHYYGGDTGMGPWIQKARETLARSLQFLTSDSGFLNFMSRWAYVAIVRLIVVHLLALYWKLFLRLTLLVSRQCEYRADELASAVAGAKPLVSGLRKITKASSAWTSFWQSEAVPSLQAGCHPPLAEGFRRYLEVPDIAQPLEAHVSARLAAEKANAYDTHPTFAQRSARALALPYEAVAEDDATALALFEGARTLELAALTPLLRGASQLQAVEWENLGAVYAAIWRDFRLEHGSLLADCTMGDVPRLVADAPRLGAQMRDPKGMLLTREQRTERAIDLIAMSMALALLEQGGWEARSQPGDFGLWRGEQKMGPFEIVYALRSGETSADAYKKLVTELGIADLPLAPASAALPAGPPDGIRTDRASS
jgi:Zn-dependent protease with chaperone function